MEWGDVAKTIGKIAPLVGAAVGGPVGMAGGGIVSALCAMFGSDPNDPAALDAAILADPEAALKLREFELNNQVELQKLVLEGDRLDMQDRSSAREREARIVEKTGKKDAFLYFLAFSVVCAFGALCFVLIYVPIPAGANQVVLLLFGGLVAGFTQVMNYFFGSSKSSSDKTAIMAAKS